MEKVHLKKSLKYYRKKASKRKFVYGVRGGKIPTKKAKIYPAEVEDS